MADHGLPVRQSRRDAKRRDSLRAGIVPQGRSARPDELILADMVILSETQMRLHRARDRVERAALDAGTWSTSGAAVDIRIDRP